MAEKTHPKYTVYKPEDYLRLDSKVLIEKRFDNLVWLVERLKARQHYLQRIADDPEFARQEINSEAEFLAVLKQCMENCIIARKAMG